MTRNFHGAELGRLPIGAKIDGFGSIIKKHSGLLILLAVLFVLAVYPAYRIYHVWYLNSRLEQFMAQQIVPLQNKHYDDEWFASRNVAKPTEYFIYRSEAYYIYGNSLVKDREGVVNSYWIAQQGDAHRVSRAEWETELAKYGDGTLSWSYQIRPVAGSVVCIMVTANPPKSWTGPMHSVTGVSTWSVDTSKDTWELTPYYDGPCEFRDTELLRTLLLFVK